MSATMSGGSVGFGPQGFGASAPHFSQQPPAQYVPQPPLPPAPPAAEFDYSHGVISVIVWFNSAFCDSLCLTQKMVVTVACVCVLVSVHECLTTYSLKHVN